MDPVLDAAITVLLYAVQLFWLMAAMIRVTRPGIPHNSFRKMMALNLATIPVVGWIVARRWDDPVRREVLWMHRVTLAVTAVGFLLPS